MLLLWAVARVHKILLICVLCKVNVLGSGKGKYVFSDLCNVTGVSGYKGTKVFADKRLV